MLRRRNVNVADVKLEEKTAAAQVKSAESHDENVKSVESNNDVAVAGTYWLTRIVLLRYVAFIYCKSLLMRNFTVT
jgi:hypothetical protein